MAYAGQVGFVNGGMGGYAALAIAIAFVLIAYKLTYARSSRGLNLPPGPPAWPVIGNIHLLGSLPHRSLDRLAKAYGPLMRLRLGSVPAIVGSSVEVATEILKTNDLAFASRPRTAAGKYTVYNYSDITWSPYGPYWRQARKICLMELFSVKRLESFEYMRVQEVSAMLSEIFQASQRGLRINLKEYLSTVSLNVISRMVLGGRYLDEDAGHKVKPREFKRMLDELFLLNGVFNIGDYIPWLNWLDLQGYIRRMKTCSRQFDSFLEDVLREHDANRRAARDFVPKDMVDVLLQLADDPQLDVKLTRNSVKAFTQDMLAGGTESSAVTVEWAMSELLIRPGALEKAVEEMDRVIGKERWVEEKDMEALEYLQCVVKETMRLHPVAPMLVPRESRENCRIAGYDIPANTRVFVNVWTIGRDERLWENPTAFRPERFLGSRVDVKGRDFELLPFGSGRRMCPGYALGLKVVQLTLANLIHGFVWQLPPNQSIEDLDMSETFGLSTPRTTPLMAVAQPRLPSHLYHF